MKRLWMFGGIEKPGALGLITPTKNNACAATEFLLNNLLPADVISKRFQRETV